jgi:hypothetical protein
MKVKIITFLGVILATIRLMVVVKTLVILNLCPGVALHAMIMNNGELKINVTNRNKSDL